MTTTTPPPPTTKTLTMTAPTWIDRSESPARLNGNQIKLTARKCKTNSVCQISPLSYLALAFALPLLVCLDEATSQARAETITGASH